MDKVPDLFGDNLIVDFGHLGMFKTKAELLEFLNNARAGSSVMCHQEMTPYIEIDGAKATGTWYLFGPYTHVTPQGEIAAWIQGRLDNEYVREDGKWKVSARRCPSGSPLARCGSSLRQ